ncbi:SIR2 family protein [Mucilaginibacter sp. FT3.2]|uniref:SIR2 family protein n=1 Tax=Mucilaginibacter sp. FT3.2 TaxID=2723090 RepID=UPI001608D549|nr:SIR2 family protein [Mucilaginibacter sp. FT3.2]MBB6235004.1 hypothetical protein [Mucilaginibacter sp. FT3.2]
MNIEIPKTIKEAIESDNLVIFAGAGLSKRFKLPTWRALVENIIEFSEGGKYNGFIPLMENKTMDPIGVLEFLNADHTSIRKYIKQNFNIKEGDFSLHKKLIELSGKIVTTNYDNAFEKADETIVPTIHSSNFNVSEINKGNEKFIFKIHGSFSEPDSCVLFKQDYERLYLSENAAINKFKTLFTDKLILFIGFSFEDPFVNSLFTSLDEIFGNNNKHYILSTDPQLFKGYQYLLPIKMDSYSDIDNIIDDLLAVKKFDKRGKEHLLSSVPTQNRSSKIAILYPNPLDFSIDEEYKHILKCFGDLDVDIFTGFLNLRTLQTIDDFDYLIILTKCFKGKLYIEDDNLKSQLVSFEDLYSSILNDKIIKVIITNEDFEISKNTSIIKIRTFKHSLVSRFFYKTLRNHDLSYIEEDITIYLNTILPPKINKGNPTNNSLYGTKLNLEFGRKSLHGIVGRIEEQASITKSLIAITNSNKLLNVKGSGGIGKTTLIKKCAYELYNRGYFKLGVSFISCENVKNFVDFEDLLINGFNLLNIVNFKDYLTSNLNKQDILIILDNFETVTNLGNKDDFKKVLSLLEFATDYANIVLTSRETLGLEFEEIYALSPLVTDDAVKLFLRDYGPITDVDELKILRMDILENLLNTNPLAIRLVTRSRTRFKFISELKEQLERHFFESTSENFTQIFKNDADINIERTKSIYQSINYSYLTLNPLERLAFEVLHLFPDGISLTDFKKCFSSSTSSNHITDKELRILRDKSLVEDINGTLQLQPIIRRFAELQFNKRDISVKQKYFNDAYSYCCFILKLIKYIGKKKSFSMALKLHNSVKNNMMNVLDYIEQIEVSSKTKVPEKFYLLNYVYSISYYIVNEKQILDYQNKLERLKRYFSEIEDAETLISVLDLGKTYFHTDFDIVYKKFVEIMPPSEIEKRSFEKENPNLNKYYDYISSIHSMEGHTIKYVNSFILNDLNTNTDLQNDFFYLGIPDTSKIREPNFYMFENDFRFNLNDVNELENYIRNLFSDEHLEIMQCTYTLSKIKPLEVKRIQKLVITNPYTAGLQQLMFAFQDADIVSKKQHFISALGLLFHIKYYYLEALYFYCLFLKENNIEEFLDRLQEGLDLSAAYYYQYLNYKFENLKIDEFKGYECNFDFYPIKLKEYIKKHDSEWALTYSQEPTF